MDMTFGEKLKLLAKQKGYSRRRIAEEIGDVSPATVSNWANDIYQPPLDVAARIARLFGVSVDYLAFEEIETVAPAPQGLLSEEERSVLRLYRALGLNPDQAMRALSHAAHAAMTPPLQTGTDKKKPLPSESEGNGREQDRRPGTAG